MKVNNRKLGLDSLPVCKI